VAGCDGVFHVASPLSMEGITDPQVWSSLFNLFGCYFFQDAKFLTCLDFLCSKTTCWKTICYLFMGEKKTNKLSTITCGIEKEMASVAWFVL
jgi:hypothetical protein